MKNLLIIILVFFSTFLSIFSIQVCPAGFYCQGTCQPDLVNCFKCQAGYYCPNDDGPRYNCPRGHYCDVDGLTSPKDCNEGTYQNLYTKTECYNCPIGHYCPQKEMIDPLECEIGTYQPSQGATSSCQPCLEGYYCDEKEMSIGKKCSEGYFCPTGSSTQTICTEGEYCDRDGLSQPTGKCEAGYFCPEGSISAQQNVCPQRQYCPEGSIQPKGCPCPANDNIHGNCTHETINPTCYCDDGYGGSNCGIYTCYGIDQNSQEVCSGNGFCGNIDDCQCYQGYKGKKCEEYYCFGKLFNDSTVCNMKGKCIKTDNCVCEGGWGGEECLTDPLLTIIPIVISCSIIFILICLIIIIAIPITLFIISQRKKLKFFGKFKDEIEILNLEEQARNDNTSASFSISKKFFTIDYRDITLKKLIGKGAFSQVFMCEWDGQLVALKRFQTSSLGTKEQDFKDFEKELGLLSSISHPNIINFYGATLNPPQVGILLEYCPTDLSERIEYKKKKITFYQKMLWCEQIASAVLYLHKRDIIHRDLKLENILLNK